MLLLSRLSVIISLLLQFNLVLRGIYIYKKVIFFLKVTAMTRRRTNIKTLIIEWMTGMVMLISKMFGHKEDILVMAKLQEQKPCEILGL